MINIEKNDSFFVDAKLFHLAREWKVWQFFQTPDYKSQKTSSADKTIFI